MGGRGRKMEEIEDYGLDIVEIDRRFLDHSRNGIIAANCMRLRL